MKALWVLALYITSIEKAKKLYDRETNRLARFACMAGMVKTQIGPIQMGQLAGKYATLGQWRWQRR